MTQGVRLADPARFDVRGSLSCGADVDIDINCVFEGTVSLGNGVRIGANCCIANAVIDDGAVIHPYTHIDGEGAGVTVGEGALIGPFARLRPGAELGPDESPWEAGLGFSVKLDKPGDFIGKAALMASRDQPLRKKLVTVLFDSAEAYAWGGEAMVLDGQPAGELSSVGHSPLARACVGLGYVRGPGANRPHAGTPALVELWGEPVPVRLYDEWPSRRH